MGVIQDLLDNAKTFNSGSPREGNSRAIVRQLKSIQSVNGDFDRPASCASGNEVQSIAVHVHATGGTYTLTFTLHSGETFTTGNLAYTAAHAAVQSAINSAATSASIVGWTNDDIVVAGAGLNSAPMTFTFSGASVAGLNHSPISVNPALMTYTGGQGQAGAVTTTTVGTGGTDAVQKIAKYLTTVGDGALNVTGGTYTLHFAPNGGSAFTTAAIAWNADHTAVQTAINTANLGLADDTIVVAGAGLQSADMTFTFSGSGVTHLAQPLIVVDSTSLTATVVGTPGAITTPTPGQTVRYAWAALIALGILNPATALPDQGVAPVGLASHVLCAKGSFPHQLDNETVKAIVNEISSQDDKSQAVKDAVLAALGF